MQQLTQAILSFSAAPTSANHAPKMPAPPISSGNKLMKNGSGPNLPPLNEASEIRKMRGGSPPPHTELTPNVQQIATNDAKKPGQEEDDLMSMTQERGAAVLDHNARLYFELDSQGKGMNLHSFHTSYCDYLDDYNLVDVSSAALPSFLSSQFLFENKLTAAF